MGETRNWTKGSKNYPYCGRNGLNLNVMGKRANGGGRGGK
jgi:hypothetical protein